ncbi:DEAD/DEAH box helicase [Nitratireductor indicus C115]|uniref:DEAD/DEAH box helicase n=1 Tax=Nitratireductor indicus C115 TaxID=1231190 RepID=K2P327_9HYPH|nr:ATP-dependent helicase HrpB [Nitratireductor indicus]EKF44474.1 DEAD/DEAH box helicase [Nitratireductor indicus C115]SFQ30088.1 ATP-dependent helicase HrpB [Nitratireductor indicus]
MSRELPHLPVTEVLPVLQRALEERGKAVLVAPPGAGKTTLVPLALLDADWASTGRIVLLEPRRLAARAAARRMAALLGEEPGETVGYAMRMERRLSPRTRILVVTEGVLARMIVEDPELSGISAVLFDEFHERSLDGDFALALALDAQAALRPDLRLLVMSATLDGARVASLLGDAPVIESEGRSFPVETRYRERPAQEPIEDAMARAIREVLAEEEGSVLAFLPGQREIERTAERLADRLPKDVDITPLYGGLEGKAQDAAIRPPATGRRKVVLATAIAETSVTIDGVRVVIDSGLSRLPKFEPATGLTRLETVRVSRASADQRAGRAGRTAPGIALRLWRAEQTAALPAFTPPEILDADLSGLLLDCAAFGVADPASLAFLDPPPPAALAEARALLARLGALDGTGRLTPEGAAMRKLALPVRLAHMVSVAARRGHGQAAADLAVLLSERGLGGNAVDLDERLQRFRRERGTRAEQARSLAIRLAKSAGGDRGASVPQAGALLIHAWPDRVAKARGAFGRFVLANGRGGVLAAEERLAGAAYLVVADLQGRAENARIASAAAIAEEEIFGALGDDIEESIESGFDRERGSLRQRKVRRLGAIVFSTQAMPSPSGVEADRALVEAVRANGLSLLPWDKETEALRGRLGWLHHAKGKPWPDMSDEALTAHLEDWLQPFLTGESSLAKLKPTSLREGLVSLVPHEYQRRLKTFAPTHYDAPSGSHVPIRYEAEGPVLAIRVQELFGLKTHPSIAEGIPLKLELLSPAHRPIQTTLDLPGFWAGSWADVRADMRGRYPKHVWPDDPANAAATHRAKPRGT